jgi:hypothetical protein
MIAASEPFVIGIVAGLALTIVVLVFKVLMEKKRSRIIRYNCCIVITIIAYGALCIIVDGTLHMLRFLCLIDSGLP